MLSDWVRADVHLNVDALGLTDASEIQVAQIIAEETEIQRESEYERHPVPQGTRRATNKLSELLAPTEICVSYADTLSWDVLLTLGGCARRCASRANLTTADLISFAESKCKPANLWVLFWYEQWIRTLTDQVGAEQRAEVQAKALEQAQSVRERILEGASLGGRKSAETRRLNARTPSKRELTAARERLISAGWAPRNVNSELARQYHVTPGAIRMALKRE
jgi:hypothetical protein